MAEWFYGWADTKSSAPDTKIHGPKLPDISCGRSMGSCIHPSNEPKRQWRTRESDSRLPRRPWVRSRLSPNVFSSPLGSKVSARSQAFALSCDCRKMLMIIFVIPFTSHKMTKVTHVSITSPQSRMTSCFFVQPSYRLSPKYHFCQLLCSVQAEVSREPLNHLKVFASLQRLVPYLRSPLTVTSSSSSSSVMLLHPNGRSLNQMTEEKLRIEFFSLGKNKNKS